MSITTRIPDVAGRRSRRSGRRLACGRTLRRPSRADVPLREEGFTLVEVSVAIGVFAVVSIFLAGILAGGLKGIMLGRQRAAATADASEVLETARSLAYADLGLASDDQTLDGDPAIVTTTATTRTYDGEPIAFAASTVDHPFKPHVQTATRSPTTLVRYIYVTGVDTNLDGQYDVKRVTVVVSWERNAVPGVANSVTASTIVSPSSPGTPGNPPLAGCATPPCASSTPPPFPPLAGTTSSRAPDAFMEAVVGSGSDVDSTSGTLKTSRARLLGANGAGSNVLDARSVVGCNEQLATLEGSLGDGPTASTPAERASASADSVSNPGPNQSTKNQAQSTTGVVPPPIVVTGTVTGSAACSASAVTSGTALPSESGTVTTTSFFAQADTSSSPLDAILGKFNLVEMTGAASAQSASQSSPADKRMDASATHGVSDLRVMRQVGLTSGMVDLGADEGLVQVSAYQATAQANASTSTGGASVGHDPTKPLVVKIWHGGDLSSLTDHNGNAVRCASNEGGYCVLRPSVADQQVVRLNRTLCKGLLDAVCLVDVHVEATVAINPARVESLTLGDGITRVYRVEYSPVNVTARVWAANTGSTSRGFDLRTTTDAGRVVACAKYGFLPGGC